MKWILQFLITMALSTFIPDNLIKTLFLLIFWLFSFWPVRKNELILFFVCCGVFTVANYGALAKLNFDFFKKDIFLMPFNEIFMWGFYCLNALRFLEHSKVSRPGPAAYVLVYGIVFSTLFSVVASEIWLAALTSCLLVIALLYFRSRRDFFFLSYFLGMGIWVEFLGLHFQLWHYPKAQFFEFPLWTPLMWANIGLIVGRASLFFDFQEVPKNQEAHANADPYQETLDNPDLPFDLRWRLISEIDRMNHRYGIYKEFLKVWRPFFEKSNEGDKISVFEVGSGSGGLSLEIKKWCERNDLDVQLHLFDTQTDIMKESLKKFPPDKQPEIHIATSKYLEVFPDQAFDYIVSLHVLHHIQPFSEATKALYQMHRIARKGLLLVDLQTRSSTTPIYSFYSFLHGTSAELRADGTKSLKRAYPFKQVLKLVKKDHGNIFQIDGKSFLFAPYWWIRSQRK